MGDAASAWGQAAMTVAQLALPTSLRSNGREPPRAHSDAVRLILVGLAYFTLAYLGLRLASVNPSATPIWAPTGLAISAVLLWGHRITPAVFIAAFLINQLTAGSIFTSIAIAGGNTLEAVTAGYLVRHWAEGEQVFDTPTGVAKFTLISLAATMVSATIGVSSLTLAGYAEVSSFISVWLTWGLGDLAGAACCYTRCGALGQKRPSITQATSNYANRIDLSCRHSCRSYCFQSDVAADAPSRRGDFCGHSAVALGLTPPRPARYRYRGAYHFRIRSLVHRNAMRALRKAKSERLFHTVAGLHDQRCRALPRSEHRCKGEKPH